MGVVSCGTTMIDQGLYQGLLSVDWDTTPKTATFTGVAGNGYFCNTSSGPFTLNLPAGSVGDIIAVSDYASTFNLTQVTAVYTNPESSLGTPDLTVSSVSNFSAPSATRREQDLYSAVDVGDFDSTDYGVVWEVGGSGQGFAASLEAGGQLWVAAYDGDPWADPAMAYLKVDVSSYYNTPGTFYTTINVSSKQFKLYFQPGGPTSGNQAVSLGTSTAGTTVRWSNNNGGALGQVNGAVVNFGFTNYNAAFTGDAQELRWYYNTAEPSPFQDLVIPGETAGYLTISPNGTDKINGINEDYIATTKGVSLVLLYVDSTRGWKVIGGGEIDATGGGYITARGGTVTTDGDYKIHTFTGPGTFYICETAVLPSNNSLSYLAIAGGGGAGNNGGGGGGAGGVIASCTTASTGSFPVTVGAGGAGSNSGCFAGSSGSNSILSCISSSAIGGGGGASRGGGPAGQPGGSGGGGGGADGGGRQVAGCGTPGQGNPGGTGTPDLGSSSAGGGGGGYCTAGTNGASQQGGDGGNGYLSTISGSPIGYAGGGAGSGLDYNSFGGQAGSVQAGYGGGGPENDSKNGRPNSGGGGGGLGDGTCTGCNGGGNGGSGVVIIRYKFQ